MTPGISTLTYLLTYKTLTHVAGSVVSPYLIFEVMHIAVNMFLVKKGFLKLRHVTCGCLPVAQMIASISSTNVPSVNWTPDDVRRAMSARTCTLPDIMLRGRSSFTTTALAVMSWFGRNPYRAWSKRAFTAFWNRLVTMRDGIKRLRKWVKRVDCATSRGRPLFHTRGTHHAPFFTLRYTCQMTPICLLYCSESHICLKRTNYTNKRQGPWTEH